MKCRSSCGACSIAPSINSPIPGMPSGKPAGVGCVQLLDNFRCAIFGKLERPAFFLRACNQAGKCAANHAMMRLNG